MIITEYIAVDCAFEEEDGGEFLTLLSWAVMVDGKNIDVVCLSLGGMSDLGWFSLDLRSTGWRTNKA